MSISKTAFKIIKENLNNYSDNVIYNIYKNTNFFHIKRFTCILLTKFSKWKSLKYILEMLSDPNFHFLSKSALKNWIKNFNRQAIFPLEDEVNQIKDMLSKSQYYLTKDELEFIRFVL